MKKHITPKARKESLVIQESDNEILIYDLESNKAVCLNETSALIWQACDGNNEVSDITALVGKQLNSPVNDDFVWLALDQLKKENLIENKDEVAIDFNGMSRREVIKKVGMGAMIALPIVSSLVAPTAAKAGTPGACGSICNNNGECTMAVCNTCRQVSPGSGTKTCQA
jgi:hypothetical protein